MKISDTQLLELLASRMDRGDAQRVMLLFKTRPDVRKEFLKLTRLKKIALKNNYVRLLENVIEGERRLIETVE